MGGDGDDGAGPEQQHRVGIVRSDKEIWNKGSDYNVGLAILCYTTAILLPLSMIC